MLNQESVAAVEAARFGAHFVRPLYDTYGFARIPGTIERLLTGVGAPPLPPAALAGLDARYTTVVLVLIDAFGWRFFEPRLDHDPFLRRFAEHGVVSRLTTMFPSTTSAHVTALHTGLDPAASGIFEWFYYEPTLGRVIAPLLFSYAGDKERETLAAAGVDPAPILPSDTLYRRLAAAGVRSTVLQHASYAQSSYTRVVCAGAEVLGYRTTAEALVTLTERLAAHPEPSYSLLYLDTVDALAHIHGPDSPHVAAEIDVVLTALERVLHPALQRLGRPALLLLSADHGQITIDPATALLANRLVPGLEAATPHGTDGRPLAPSGSSRDLFFYLREGHAEDSAAALATALAGHAELHRTADLIAAWFFGPNPSPAFLSRVGSFVALPYPGSTVWWDDQRFPMRFKGSHGGLTPEEAHTQFAALHYG